MKDKDKTKEQLISELAELHKRLAQLKTSETERKQAEAKIKRAAEEWKTTFDSISDLVSINDTNFKLIRVNKAFADVFKLKPKELIGRACYELVHGTNEPVPHCPFKKLQDTGKPQSTEFFEPYLGIYLGVSTSPLFNDKGKTIACVHITRDISERKKTENEIVNTNELLRAVFNSTENAICVINTHDFTITKANDVFLREYGAQEEQEVIGKTCYEVTHHRSQPCEVPNDICPLRDTVLNKIHSVVEHRHSTKENDKQIIVEVVTFPLLDESGKVTQVVHSSKDITERKRMEETLRKSKEKYEALINNIPEAIYSVNRQRKWATSGKNDNGHLGLAPAPPKK